MIYRIALSAFIAVVPLVSGALAAGRPPVTDDVASVALSPARFEPPYPFTPSELWTMLSKVIALPPDALNRESVGNIIGVPAVNWSSSDTGGIAGFGSDTLAGGRNWYFNVDLPYTNAHRSQRAFFFLIDPHWLPTTLPGGMCVDVAKSSEDLVTQGWSTPIEESVALDAPFTRDGMLKFQRPGQTLHLKYHRPLGEPSGHDCLLMIIQFDQVR